MAPECLMSQRCAQEVVDSGREAFGQRGLRERAGAFHAGGGPLRIPVSLHWSEHREDEGVEPARGHRPTPRSSPTPACLSSTPPSIRGSQVPAERGQAKAGREESETGATDAPPAGPPKLLNYRDSKRQARGKRSATPARLSADPVVSFSCFPMSCVTSSKSQWFSGPRFAPFAMGTASRRSYWAVFPLRIKQKNKANGVTATGPAK